MNSSYLSPPVGLVDVSIHEPERFMTAEELGELSDIPADVIREKFGLEGKRIAGPGEEVSDLCIAAARPLLERHDPAEIDAVVYFGSHWKDYSVWQAAPKVQHELGIEGFSLEAINVSAGAPVAMKIVRDLLAADEHLRNVLLVGASKESGLIDYTNPRARFMYTFGDGAVAALLRRGHPENVLLGSSLFTDGAFADFVRVAGGGSVHPASHATVGAGLHTLDVSDPQAMKEGLDPVTVKNFLTVAREAMERSGFGPEGGRRDPEGAKRPDDIDLLLPIHMKPSIHRAILDELGVAPERSVYLDRNGHMSAVDPLFALSLARDRGMLSAGDRVMLLAAGTGYTWAASVLLWGTLSDPR